MVETKVQFTVQYSLADIQGAYESFYSSKKYLWILVVIGAAGLVMGILQPTVRYAIFCGLTLFGVSFCAWFRIKTMAKKTLASPSFSSQQEIILDETGLSMDSEAAKCTVNWSQFLNWSENEKSFLLQTTPYTFLIVPKRCLSNSQPDIVRELISSHIENRARGNSKMVIVVFLIFMIVTFLFGLLNPIQR
jgi:hypothetical protein